MTQPEALRLADYMDHPLNDPNDVADAVSSELRRLHQHEFVNEVWQVKTQWVQDTAKPEELGMHRADVMRQRLEQAKVQRDALLEALRTLLSYAFTLEMRLLDADGEHRAMRIARAAIAKAEGENHAKNL